MAEINANVEYRIVLENGSFLLNKTKFHLLEAILNLGSISEASKVVGISYRTAINYINKIEEDFQVKIVTTRKGGKGGGGGTTLTEKGFLILKECQKINVILTLHKNINELEVKVLSIDEDNGIMVIGDDGIKINIPFDNNFDIGDKVLALISYDNIFIMLEPYKSSIRNVIKAKIIGLFLIDGIIRLKLNINKIYLYCDITISAQKDLNLSIGDEVYFAFKAMSVAILKL